MKFSGSTRDDISLNLAPLIDVVFLLLIFFMVTTSFNTDNALDLTLPQASAEQKPIDGLLISISINKRDEISIQNKLAHRYDAESNDTRQALSNEIANAVDQAKLATPSLASSQPTINIAADKSASHGTVILLLDAISALGINQIQFAIDPNQVKQ